MSKSTTVLGNYSRRLKRLTSLSRTINGIARSAESISSSLMFNGIVRSAESISSSLMINGAVRSAVPPWSSLMINGAVRSAVPPWSSLMINGAVRSAVPPWSSLMINGAVRSAVPPWSSLMINGAVRSAVPPWSSLMINGAVRSAVLPSFSRTINGIVRSAELNSILSRKMIETLAPFREKAQFEEADWFPHGTFPRHLFNWSDQKAYSDQVILSYYRENWSKVRQVIENELSECQVDREAKEVVREALTAHENGQYRLVTLSLFAAIERAVRVGLFQNNVGSIPVRNRLVELVESLPISVLPGGYFGIVGFTQLSHHLYESIHTNYDRDRLLDASIPNRHAAIHGLVAYASEKSSLNAIFFAIFVFQILTVLKLRYIRSS